MLLQGYFGCKESKLSLSPSDPLFRYSEKILRTIQEMPHSAQHRAFSQLPPELITYFSRQAVKIWEKEGPNPFSMWREKNYSTLINPSDTCFQVWRVSQLVSASTGIDILDECITKTETKYEYLVSPHSHQDIH